MIPCSEDDLAFQKKHQLFRVHNKPCKSARFFVHFSFLPYQNPSWWIVLWTTKYSCISSQSSKKSTESAFPDTPWWNHLCQGRSLSEKRKKSHRMRLSKRPRMKSSVFEATIYHETMSWHWCCISRQVEDASFLTESLFLSATFWLEAIWSLKKTFWYSLPKHI